MNKKPTGKLKRALIRVELKEGVLDPQGKTIAGALEQMGYHQVKGVRSGKTFEVTYEGSRNDRRMLDEICRKLLANPVIEDYRIEELE